MKFYFFAVLTLLFTNSSLQAQNSDFAPVGAKWIYSELDFALRSVPHVIESVAKENYQGKWCSKLELNPPSVGVLPTPTYVYSQNDTVFFYSIWTNRFEMLYDFTAEVGDQWVVGGVYSVDNEGNTLLADTITVDSIGYIPVNGSSLKVWFIKHGLFYDWGRRIYDKIGNEGMFAPKYAMWELQVGDLRCFETPDTAFHFVSYPCDSTWFTINATTAPAEVLKIQVSPNPFQERIQITVQPLQSAHHFLLFNSMGNLIFREEFNGNFDFETSGLTSGLYHWIVVQEGQLLGRGCCLKLE
ncbi:MAG: T9SS type A sorting domain-containing protein [Saprospiraceae bacterium]|nr:T9SS type A sorting domain-containing protein [Saprospiraceae bacterium]